MAGTLSDAAILEAYAAEVGASLIEQWGRVAIAHEAPFDLDKLRQIAERDNFSAIGRFGVDLDIELRLSSEAPADSSLLALQQIVAAENEQRALLNPADGWVAARHALSVLTEVEVRYDRSNWCLGLDTLHRVIQTNWIQIADSLVDADVTVGSITVPLRRVAGRASDLILEPACDRPTIEGPEQAIWDAIASLADVAAWRQMAVNEIRSDDGLTVALHRDQAPIVPLDPTHASGGLTLWKWLHATEDANRDEALRYILRFLTASAVQIPNGASVLALAERYRIALSHDKAAEVQRAISDGRALIRRGLQDARRTLSTYTEDTVKTAQAAVIASIGIVALVARNAATLPDWLLGMVTVVAIVGVLTLMYNRWRRIGELGSDIEALQGALSEEKAPLLPEPERVELTKGLKDFNAARKVLGGRAIVILLGLVAISVIMAAGIWIICQPDDETTDRSDGAMVEMVPGAGNGTKWARCETLNRESPPMCTKESASY